VRAWLKVIIIVIAGLVTAGCDGLKPRYSGINFTGASWGRDFRLPDPEGRERTLADFRGKYVMVFFGYLECPVVCPTALVLAAEARKALGADRERVQVIFITLDPERDTPARVKEYAAAFDPSFIGLRGDLERTREVAKEFRVYFEKVPNGGSYSIDHTALTYVFDDVGRLRLGMTHQHTLEQYVADLRTLMKPES
jgi:protein SCO1